VVKKSPSEVICTGTCGAPIHRHQGRRLGKVMFSVERVFRSAIHLRVTREVEAMDGAWIVQKTDQDADPSILSHRGQPGGVLYSPHEGDHDDQEHTSHSGITAHPGTCPRWWKQPPCPCSEGRSFADVVQQVDTVGALM
jgi:hypothetical protein